MSSSRASSTTNTTNTLTLFNPLPIELLENIGSYLDVRDIANLRLACGSLHHAHIFARFLVGTLKLFQTKKKLKKQATSNNTDVAITFSPIPPALAPFIRNLHIFITCTATRFHQWETHLGWMMQEVSRFKELKSFRLTWTSQPEPLAAEAAARMKTAEGGLLAIVLDNAQNTLESLELEHLSMFSSTPSPLPLSRPLPALKSLGFTTKFEGAHGFFAQAKELLIHNPTLKRLDVTLRERTRNTIIVQALIPPRSLTSDISLHHLILRGKIAWLPNSSLFSMPSFSSLRRLTLLTQTEVDELWDLLRVQNIQLQYLCIEHIINPALIAYLTSFQGLQEFLFVPAMEEDHNTLPQRLTLALRSQAPTIQRLLLVMAAYLSPNSQTESDEPSSRADPHTSTYWPSPADFPSLKYLHIRSPTGRSLQLSTLQNMFTWLEQFPALEHAYTPWHHSTTNPLSLKNVATQLIARTGRPRSWSCSYFPATCTWEVHPGSQDEWVVVKRPFDLDHHLYWD